jgi:hypothetical protein
MSSWVRYPRSVTDKPEPLDDEDAWARSFREKPELLRSMAREALEEHRRGETRPLGPGRTVRGQCGSGEAEILTLATRSTSNT